MHRYPTMTSWGPSDPPSGLCVTFFTKHFRLVISYFGGTIIIDYRVFTAMSPSHIHKTV